MKNTDLNPAIQLLSQWGQKVVIVDVESTGGDLYLDRLTEVALIRIENGQIKERSWLINPEQPIPSFVVNLTGISNEMVKNKPVFADVAKEIESYVQDAILIAHNVHFDYSFLRFAFLRANIKLHNHVLCSVRLSRKLYPEFKKHNLDSIIERMAIELPSRHRALPDAQAILVFLAKSLKTLGKMSIIEQMDALLCPKRLPTALNPTLKNQIQLFPDDFGYYVLLNKSGEIIAKKVCTYLFRECCDDLSKFSDDILSEIDQIIYEESVGLLSAQIQLILWQKNQGREQEQQGSTITLVPNEKGWLQAKIETQYSGIEHQTHYGYFTNPKAAKKALLECAHDHLLCLNRLGFIKPTPKEGVPCAKENIGECLGACVGREEIASHNLRTQKALQSLPTKDWYFTGHVLISEIHPILGQATSKSFIFYKGRLLLGESRTPFFHAALLTIIKKQVRSNHNIKISQLDVDNETW